MHHLLQPNIATRDLGAMLQRGNSQFVGNWIKRNVFATHKFCEGHAHFPLITAYEAAMLDWARRAGVSQRMLHKTWVVRLQTLANKQRGPNNRLPWWELAKRAIEAGLFDDFEERDLQDSVEWTIVPTPGVFVRPEKELGEDCAIYVPGMSRGLLASAKDSPEKGKIILNTTVFGASVRTALREAGVDIRNTAESSTWR